MSFLYAFPVFGSAMTALNSAIDSLGERCVHAGLSHKTSAVRLPPCPSRRRFSLQCKVGKSPRISPHSRYTSTTARFPGVVAEDLTDRHEVPEALRQLLPLEGDEPVVHPGPGPLDAPGALADHRLALVVRELQVDAASVDVERRSEILVRHRVALHMPAGATVAPGARPGRLVPLRSLPEGQVERIFLPAFVGRTPDHDVLELLVRQDPERMLRLPRPEVDLPVHRI